MQPATRWTDLFWRLTILLLLGGQAWLTLGLFGDEPFAALCDDRPIVSGAHPQSLYLGAQSSNAVLAHGQLCVYDTAFQAGFPITPIFDGSRLAELYLLLGGGSYRPAAYKFGVAGMCLLVPVLLIVACRGAGLGLAATALATFLGQLVWWGPTSRTALEAGDSTLFVASLAGLAHVGLLVAFHRTASLSAWVGLLLTGALGWFAQPLLFPTALPLLLAYYLSVGVKHDFLTWHLAFWGVEVGAALLNLPWLIDWASYWWLRAPLPTATAFLTERNLATIWNAPLWGSLAERGFLLALMGSAAAGVVVLNQTGQRPAARLLGIGAGGSLLLALLGISWEPLGQVGSAAMLAPALWFAAPPAAHAWVWAFQKLWSAGLTGRGLALALVMALPLPLLAYPEVARCYFERCTASTPLTIGLNAERRALVETLRQSTTADARILWEDRDAARTASRWPALLPILTGRSFLGGIDPDEVIEHSSICLQNQAIDGKSFPLLPSEALAGYCERYNIGWVVAWSPAVIDRLAAWPGAERRDIVSDGGSGVLFRIKRPARFALQGKADLLQADGRSVVLKDVVPDEAGVVVVSLHYQTGMRASPSRVQVEREISGDDKIGFLRLRLAGPAQRVTLTWDR